MKLSLIFISCFLSMVVNAQEKKTSAKWATVGPTTITFTGYSEGKTQVGHDDNGNLVVKGDSAAAIKLLFKMINEGHKRESNLWDFFSKQELQIQKMKQILDKMKTE